MSVDELLADMETEFRRYRRKFATGLLLAFVRFLRELDALGGKFDGWDAFIATHPIQDEHAAAVRIR